MDLVSNKSHHQFFKKLVSLWFLPILILFAGCAEKQKDQPNVILVMADDMGWITATVQMAMPQCALNLVSRNA